MAGIFGSGRGIGGMVIQTQRKLLNGLGLGLIVFGIYLLLAYLGIIQYTPRFENILRERNQMLIVSIISIIIGGLINEKIRNIFQR